MKIVDLTEFWSERGGGVRTYLTHLLREGPARGHEVTVVTAGPKNETTRVEGGELVRVAGPRQPYDRTYHALVRLGRALDAVRERRPDVVQASSPFLAGWAVARLAGVPVRALVAHADLAGQYLRPALELLVARPSERAMRPAWSYWAALGKRFDTTIVAGPWMADPMRRAGCPRVEVVPFGFERVGLGPEHHDPALRRELLGADADRPGAVLLTVACRLAFEKRVGLVIDAARALAKDRPVALAILGDGPERARLEKRARGANVSFLGFRKGEDGRRFYAKVLATADAFVHGSASETFGFGLCEALASGTPIVVADVGAAAFQGDATCREVYPAYDGPEAVAAAVTGLAARPEAEVRAAAARWGAGVPTLGQHFDLLFAHYERKLAARPAA
jgi:alpha-1,6-mannosyltransferase